MKNRPSFAWRRTLCVPILALLTAAIPMRADLPIGVEPSDHSPTLNYSFDGNALILTWDSHPPFHLQGSDEVDGPWQFVPGATSPYNTPLNQAHMFYRLIGSGQQTPALETISARSESRMGVWHYYDPGYAFDDWMYTIGTEWTPIRSGVRPEPPYIRNRAGNFLTLNDNTPIVFFRVLELTVCDLLCMKSGKISFRRLRKHMIMVVHGCDQLEADAEFCDPLTEALQKAQMIPLVAERAIPSLASRSQCGWRHDKWLLGTQCATAEPSAPVCLKKRKHSA